MKQEDVAQVAGITRPMLSAYERGRVQPTLDTLDRLLRALDCDLSALSQALKIVTSMGKVGRKRKPDEAQAAPAQDEAPEVEQAATRAPFTLEGLDDGEKVEFLDTGEEAAFHDLLEAHRKWLLNLRRAVIYQTRSDIPA